ncbi:glycosyl transferase, group 1 [Thermosulfidibacter takaii ABI70S6]|uniref:Glycosyl transferase, group 1 n=1 Tax=Thermosulfidibacter takaii (strain DSM 17441 / JCM 13301 / NBRC 103674 / ABI70S6) TaxID=1298851 RepID=A0A0S3QS26_THET7|nr:glycosyltransferase family 4 protein [Thermosulfidibacter takaii]BAT71128.1 glycosyl transferase, group 1 [Thermosulfidibacter takaii ABI70S6]
MKIVYLSLAKFPSQAANTIETIKFCDALASEGHDVTLLVPATKQKADIGSIKDFYGIEYDFDIQFVPIARFLSKSWGYMLALPRILKKINPDLVYGRSIHGCFIASVLGFNTMLELHEPVPDGKFFQRLAVRFLANANNSKLVSISHSLRFFLLDRDNLADDSIFVIPLGATNVVCRKANLLNENKSLLNFGYVGSFSERRGVGLIIHLADTIKYASFHIIGGRGDLPKRLLERENVFLYGFIPHRKVIEYIEALDVGLLLNKGTVKIKGVFDDFTSPLKLYEYMMCGKPVLSSDLPVLGEVVERKFAVILSLNKRNEWASKVKKLVQPRVRRVMGINAKRRFLDRYDRRLRVRFLIRRFREVCK